MRILHFADLHIGVETYGRPLPDRGWSSRMQDFLDALDHLVNYAIDNSVDAIIFAGDAYKAREPSQTHQREFARRIQRLSVEGIATFLLVGNHDLPNAEGRAHALEIYRTLTVPNVLIGDDSWFRAEGFRPQVLQTRSGPLQVAFLPWPQVSRLLASDSAVAGMTIEQVHHEVEVKMASLIAQQADNLDPDVPAVLACHVSINDPLVTERPGSEQWMTVGSAPTLLKSALQSSKFDYVALGHHHNNIDLRMQTPGYYAGSMQPVDFGEEAQKKGFMVFDIDPTKRRGERIFGTGLPRLEEVPTRRFVTIEVAPTTDDPTAEVCNAVSRAEITGSIVRVVVKLTGAQSSAFRVPEVRRLLDDAHYVAGIRTILPDERRSVLPAGAQPDAVSPIETLELYLRHTQVDQSRQPRLLAAARELIETTGTANA
jgi:exonuclease SbcD